MIKNSNRYIRASIVAADKMIAKVQNRQAIFTQVEIAKIMNVNSFKT